MTQDILSKIVDPQNIDGLPDLIATLQKLYYDHFVAKVASFNNGIPRMLEVVPERDEIIQISDCMGKIQTKLLPLCAPRGTVSLNLMNIEGLARQNALIELSRRDDLNVIGVGNFIPNQSSEFGEHLVVKDVPAGVTLTSTNGHIFCIGAIDGIALSTTGSIECFVLRGGAAASRGSVIGKTAQGPNAQAIAINIGFEMHHGITSERFRCIDGGIVLLGVDQSKGSGQENLK
jgi:hypothetical protein